MLRSLLLGMLLLLSISQSDAQNLPHYEMDANLYPSEHRVHADLKMTVDTSYLADDKLQLLFSQDAEIKTLTSNQLSDTTVSPMKGPMQRYTLHFDSPEDKAVKVRFEYDLVIPETHQINRITEQWIELNIDSFWHPILATTPSINYDVTVDLNSDHQLISGDRVTKTGDQTYQITNRIPRRDIPFSASPNWNVSEGKWVKAYSAVDDVPLDSLAQKADNCLSFLKQYIDQPEDFRSKRILVVSPRKDVGYSRKNYIVLSDVSKDNDRVLGAFLAHEFSHYWFSGADPFSKNHWLNESFAEFASMGYIKKLKGEEAYQANLSEKQKRAKEDPKPLGKYQSRPSYIAMYKKGPIILHHFQNYIGADKFQRLVNRIIDEEVSTNEQLFSLIQKMFGKDAESKLTQLMNDI